MSRPGSRRGWLLWLVPPAVFALLLGRAVVGHVSDPGPSPAASGSPHKAVRAGGASRRPADTAGSVAVGAAGYPVPAGARFVAPTGDDAATGSAGAPWRTVRHAVDAVADDTTLVLRGGSYHESVTLPDGKRLTMQAYPHEAVWFDGSRPVQGWVPDGGRWYVEGWTVAFDHSPTYTSGAPDGGSADLTFVDPDHPLAAEPDQVFVDGVGQRQVGSVDEVVAGSFFVDPVAARLYVGSDPAGHRVRASDLTTALTVQGAGSVLRGFGVRRYATSVPLLGTVRALADRVRLVNLVVRDNATQGVFLGGAHGTGVVVDHVTSEGNGMMGLAANTADGLRAVAVRVVGNNVEHFNASPASGGFKITRSRDVAITASRIADNDGTGLWLDESVDGAVVTGDDLVGNTVHGASFEISARGVFADDLFLRNGSSGLKINNSSEVSVWGNTLAGNGRRPLWLAQDQRQAADPSVPGHDPRRPVPDPTMTWLLADVTVRDNLLAGTDARCALCFDDALGRPVDTLRITADGDVYDTRPGLPLVTWSDGGGFSSLAALRRATGQEQHGAAVPGAADDSGRPTDRATSHDRNALPLDDHIARLVGRVAGERHVGAFWR